MANVGQFVYAWIESLMARDDEGQGMVEYGLIIAFVAIVCIAGLTVLSGKINALFDSLNFG
jgi:pilus assembly protein Flp/PilA